MKRLFYLALIFFLGVSVAVAGDISLTWTANTEPDLAGYQIFMRTDIAPYDYTNPIKECDNPGCDILNLSDGIKYYFVVRAFDNEVPRLISGDSNEVSYYKPGAWEGVRPGNPTGVVATEK